MYLHCHNCGWSQDDFWEEDTSFGDGYSPFRKSDVDWLKEKLFEDHINVDINYIRDMRGLGFDFDIEKDPKGGYNVKTTDFVAMELMRKARNIKNMRVKTWEDWEKVRDDFVCPKCGSKDELLILINGRTRSIYRRIKQESN